MANLLTRRSPSTPSLMDPWSPSASLRSLLGWDPFQDFLGVDPFRTALPGAMAGTGQNLVPAMEVKETPTSFEFKVDVPGIKEEDLEVSLSGNRLSIGGKREAETKEENETYHAYERRFGSFNRTFNLPDEVDANKIRADLKEGVLMVVVPKLPEARAKKIDVNTK